MNEVYEFLKKCGTYYLATVEGYKPRVRPFGTIDLYNNRLYIQTGKVKAVSRQIKENPQIEICAMDDGKWIRIEATVPFDISKIYVPKFNQQLKFVPIEGANHNYDTVEHIKEVLKLSLDFLTK